MVAWSLELWARDFFLSGFSTRVGWGAATLHGLPTRSCVSSGMPSEVPDPWNISGALSSPGSQEHPLQSRAPRPHLGH